MGPASALFRVSYGQLLAFAAGALVGPHAGVTVAHLSGAWAAGLVGYALAEHRVHVAAERAADEAERGGPDRLLLLHRLRVDSGAAVPRRVRDDAGHRARRRALAVHDHGHLPPGLGRALLLVHVRRRVLASPGPRLDGVPGAPLRLLHCVLRSRLPVSRAGLLGVGLLLRVGDDGHGGLLRLHRRRLRAPQGDPSKYVIIVFYLLSTTCRPSNYILIVGEDKLVRKLNILSFTIYGHSEGREQAAMLDGEPHDHEEDKQPAPADTAGEDTGAQTGQLEDSPLITI